MTELATRPRLTTVCLDCADADALAAFYAELLGWDVVDRDAESEQAGGSGWVLLADPAGGVGISCQAEAWYEPPTWPEAPSRLTKMMHFEIAVDVLDTAVATAVAAGARVGSHQPADRNPSELRVMIDPAGHPFCLFVDHSVVAAGCDDACFTE